MRKILFNYLRKFNLGCYRLVLASRGDKDSDRAAVTEYFR